MNLTAGDRLGPYEIVNLLGAGGMGEVYRARDTRLGRTVAIKVLSSEIDTPAAREQFDREARAISSLTGPNICTLFDVGTHLDQAFIVMEYLLGETLAQCLSRGPLPLPKIFEYGIQIADALDHVHRQGLIHRDLKPANIMLTKSGVKLLDFGLAKIARNPDWFSGESNLTHTITAQGPLLGTCQYVAPELFAGKKPDPRCDIFAFGAVMYEMITGRRAFDGTTQALTIAQILQHDPPPMSPDLTDPRLGALEHIVRTCLLKDPEERRQTAHDIALELRWLADVQSSPEAAGPANRRFHPAWIVAVVLLLAVSLVAGLVFFRYAGRKMQPMRLSVLPPQDAAYVANSVPAISPDGRRLAFTAGNDGKSQVWVRDLDSASAWAVAGTDGASGPFWSPDSSEVGFFANAKLRKVRLTGGPPLTLADAMQARGGSWNRNGIIIFTPSTSSPLYRVSSQGGKPEPVTALDSPAGEVSHRWPWFLPDGRHFLYVGRNADPAKTALYVGDLESHQRQRLQNIGSNAVYASPGYLLFVNERSLMAEAFDAGALRTRGEPFRIADRVDLITANLQGGFSASETGVLAYYPGDGGHLNSQLTWFDRTGKNVGTVGEPGSFIKPAISPDGRTVVVDRLDSLSGSYDVWQYDLARGSPIRLTFDAHQDGYPVWSPDGRSFAFAGNRDGHYQIYKKSAGDSAKEELLIQSPLDKFPSDWSRDGRYLIYYQIDPATKYDIWALPLTGDRKPFPLVNTPYNEHRTTLSPDVHWIAYTSDETGRDEVYVQAFPTLGNKWKVSNGGGTRPVWSRDGRELFYIDYARRLMVSAIRSGPKFEAGSPRPLFTTRQSITRFFDVSPDGQRFLLVDPLPDPVMPAINLVVNWTAGK